MTGSSTDPRAREGRATGADRPQEAAGPPRSDAASPGVGLDRRSFLGRAARAGALALLPAFLPGVFVARSAARAAPPWGVADTARAGLGPAEDLAETSRAWRAMGTLIEVRVPDLPRAEAVEAIRAVRRRVEELEAALTLYRPESPLVAFNRAPAGRWRSAPLELVEAADAAVAAARSTGGAYDPTVAPLMRAWGLVHLDGREPSHEERRAWRDRPGFGAVEVDRAGRRLRRLHGEVEIDLGGIGKGIAVDAALDELARAGSRSALVNFGGSIGVLGAPPDSPEGWPVGIVHPRRIGALWSGHHLRSGHLATSGDYERMVETPAGRAHHLLDPCTGEPARGVASVTVWAPRGVEADVRSTAVFIARAESGEAGRPLIARARGVEFFAVKGRGKGVVTALTVFEQDGALVPHREGGFDAVLG